MFLKIDLTKLNIKNHKRSNIIHEFHVSKISRDKYQIDKELFTLSGNVIFANFYAVRLFASRMNQTRDLINFPEKAIKAGQINAMGLIDEILHFVVSLYKEDINEKVFSEALDQINSELGKENVNNTLIQFIEEFPPLRVYNKEITAQDYLADESNKELVLEELLNLYIANANPAFNPYVELFDDTNLNRFSAYNQIILVLEKFFKSQPAFGPENLPLFDMLRSPAIRIPQSLSGQLEYIRTHWGLLLSKFMMRLLGGLDLIKEEEKSIFLGPGPTQVVDFKKLGLHIYDEPERFSHDRDWMPNVMMIAKSTYVWLDQLSKKYKKNIYRLDHIPDIELDILAAYGFTALWLIGLWERSPASQKIKQIMGNPEAVSSAYSLYDYVIAHDLGGEEAYDDLRNRAWKRGIRLASDMVPNHMGILSKWVIEHPDWFVHSNYPPFPNYSFNGQNLSHDDRINVHIEDGYWSHSDAAVVFKRVDNYTGDTKYIYHGNDGTSMPWNDTAQLNYLNAEVREAVIQTILHVARKFPIIRFDAAMTLAKKHYQRLWFPQPGSGGDIPSRAEFAMSRDHFDSVFPVEFWRDVVDRIAQELPDTLLLAEAFWLMEGYFVRTLGMHRVYNSAFMNMLKNEENDKYRQSIKNVMDFNPGILKRYVNFMNNPDEDTAVAQFGKDDKYFGVCTVMVTMPGLPMFGHGQIEGFTEKYGMEYRRAYWDEIEDQHLVQRHIREIFPLLKKRYLFSDVENFVLYDFNSVDGHVNENVFAYSNGTNSEKAIVLYNNKFEESLGKINYSTATSHKDGHNFKQVSLAEALHLTNSDNIYCVFKDQISGLEFIRNNKSLCQEGLYAELGAFKYHVFMDFRQVEDNEYNHYRDLTNFLNGRGVPNMIEALKETVLVPVHYPFKEIINVGFINFVTKNFTDQKQSTKAIKEFKQKYTDLINAFKQYQQIDSVQDDTIELATKNFDNIFLYRKIEKTKKATSISNFLPVLIIWITVHNLSKLFTDKEIHFQSLGLLDDWLFSKIINNTYNEIFIDESKSSEQYLLLKTLLLLPDWFDRAEQNLGEALNLLFSNHHASRFLKFNRYQEILYLNAESLDKLLQAFLIVSLIQDSKKKEYTQKDLNQKKKLITKVNKAAKDSGFRVSVLLDTIT
ncbi:alpha-amylase family glycosyl hydrolase [Calditrichota bacterium]